MPGCSWLAPRSLDEALTLRAEHGDEATVVAGGTFLGILLAQRLIAPEALLALRDVPGLDEIRVVDGELELGAMVTHRRVERSAVVADGWPALARAFSLVASPRVRTVATVGGVLADADYASDPPSMLTALDARAVLRSVRGDRELPVSGLILGHYETAIEPTSCSSRCACRPAHAPSTASSARARTRIAPAWRSRLRDEAASCGSSSGRSRIGRSSSTS